MRIKILLTISRVRRNQIKKFCKLLLRLSFKSETNKNMLIKNFLNFLIILIMNNEFISVIRHT